MPTADLTIAADPGNVEPEPPAPVPPVNWLDIELHWLANPPPAWAHADSGEPPNFPDHLFNYEVVVSFALSSSSQPAALAAAAAALHPKEDAAAEEQDGVLFRHTFTYGKFSSLDASVTAALEAASLPPPAPPAPASGAASAPPSQLHKPQAVAPAVTPIQPPIAAPAGEQPPEEEEDAPAAPLGVAWLWRRPPPDPEVAEVADPKAKGAQQQKKPDPKAAAQKRQSESQVEPAQEPADAPDPGPNHIVRIPLTDEAQAQVEQALEEGGVVAVGLRRVLSTKAAADWEDVNEHRYRGVTTLPLKGFGEPGVAALVYDAALQPTADEEEQSAGDKKGKKPPPKKGAKGAAAPPAFLVQEEEPGESHPYVEHGTALRVRLAFHEPLVCLPEKRPRPDKRPTDMIRRRLRHHRRAPDAVTQFQGKVTTVVQSLARDFQDMQGDDGISCGEDVRRRFLQRIGTSGKYRRELRDSVLRVVREHFARRPGESPESLEQFYDKLYVFLTEEAHRALGKVFARDHLEQALRESDDSAGQAKWQGLAAEAEVVQQFAMAARFHQERLGRGPDPGDDNPDASAEMWTDYAVFCLRTRDAAKAEEAFREAVSHASGQPEPAHIRSLLGLGLLLLSRDRMEEAEVCLQSAVDARGEDPLTWGCLALFHERAALVTDDESARRRGLKGAKYARLFASRAAEAAAEAGEPPAESLDLALARYTLGLWLEDLSEHCLGNLSGEPTPEVMLLRGQMHFQLRELDQEGGARDWLENRLLKRNPKHFEGLLMLGDVYASMGETVVDVEASDGSKRAVPALVVAEEYYDRALRLDEYGAPGPVYVRLGNIYNSLGRYEDARDSFIIGAKVWPCGLTWMGVGISYYRLDDMLHAEQALSESNLCNNLNPRTWTYLCLVCLRQVPARTEDADFCFKQAVKLGLRDPHLLAEIGIEQQRLGRVRLAEAALRRSLREADEPTTRLLLASTLTSMRRFRDAREEFEHVRDSSEKPTERQRAVHELRALSRLETEG
eukprot:TRINITY_DN46770_c0_g1_i1.p1 TRINITY_DN46770_c0_g1~~TRINITY_DN46770_c0_g1_i1.p1  ORF type:complete len:1042 (+),score=315.27 TRINITY_DN46770_c0_g1_i1:96-3128(+)